MSHVSVCAWGVCMRLTPLNRREGPFSVNRRAEVESHDDEVADLKADHKPRRAWLNRMGPPRGECWRPEGDDDSRVGVLDEGDEASEYRLGRIYVVDVADP